MRRGSAEVNGITMSWLEHGQGRPVVFIHGVPTSPELWREVMLRLRGVRALAWEMVGYGTSIGEGHGRDLSVAKQADHLRAWLDQQDIERPILAGHDLGGGVAQIAAVREPGRYSGLFLTNSIGYDNWPVPSVSTLKAGGRLLRQLPEPLFKALLLIFYVRGHCSLSKAVAAYRRHAPYYLRAGGPAVLENQIRWLHTQDTLDVADRLQTLPLPARVVWGAADAFLKMRYGRRFARELQAPLRVIEQGKHFIPEDHPEIVAEELQKLVDGDEGSGRREDSGPAGPSPARSPRTPVRTAVAVVAVAGLAAVLLRRWRRERPSRRDQG